MNKRNRSIFNILNILVEIPIIMAAYYLSTVIRFKYLGGFVSINMMSRPVVVAMLAYSVAIALSYRSARVYDATRYRSLRRKILTVLLINFIGMLTIFAVLYLIHIQSFSRLAVIIFYGLSSLFSIIKVLLLHKAIGQLRYVGFNKKHVIILGNGPLAKKYFNSISSHPEMGIIVDGYVSRVEKEGLGNNLGSYEDLCDILEKYDPEELVVALEPHETQFMNLALEAANKEGIGIYLIPFFNDYFPAYPSLEKVDTLNLINLRATPLDNVLAQFIKRLMDIFGSLFLIIITSPLMLICCIGVKLSSPGPILFKQERIGKHKKPFKMLKFRSMRVTSTENTAWTTGSDPRKTKFGSFIRKYSIDETPQFFNVLKGDMSLVGPRPEIPFHVRQFKNDVPRYLVRQQVKPGMTGWAQVHGLRGDTSIEARVDYDIWYIENWSLLLDIRILLMTLFGGFINNEVM